MHVLFEFPGYRILERQPTVEEFTAVLRQVGQDSSVNEVTIATALQHSLYAVVAESMGQVIGLGRILGDHATLFVIRDVMVVPSFHGIGVESAIIDALLIYLETHVPDRAVVTSFASLNHISRFEQLGFRRMTPAVIGMYRVIDRTAPDQQSLPWNMGALP